jgi:hypothetical protein
MNITEILKTNYIDKQWSISENDYEKLNWLDKSPKPTEEELESQWEEVQDKIAAAEQAKISARESALQKLAALGLTQDEIEAFKNG